MLKGLFQNLLINRICPSPLMFLQGVLGRFELHWNFSSIPKDGSDIHRFLNSKWVSTMWTVGNL